MLGSELMIRYGHKAGGIASLVLVIACGGETTSTTQSGPFTAGAGSGGSSIVVDAAGGGGATTAGSPVVGSADAAACVDCFVLYDLHWGMDGGRVPYVDTSRLGPCRSYTHERVSGANPPTTMCHGDVPGCPARTIDDIVRLLSDPDVARSLQGHLLYGVDSRPTDGRVFRFGVGVDYVDVGSPCGAGSSGCYLVPLSVSRLVATLQELDRVELASEPCRSVFGG
jgi:hypothetical protein